MKWSKYILLTIGISFFVIGCTSKENVRDEIIAKVKSSFPMISNSVYGEQDKIDDNTMYDIVIRVDESFTISGWISDPALYESNPIRYDFMNDVIYYSSPESNFTCRVTYSNREVIHEKVVNTMGFEFESNCSNNELEDIEKISSMFDVYLNNRIGYTLDDFNNAK